MDRLLLGVLATLLFFSFRAPSAMAAIVGIDFNTDGGSSPENWTWGSNTINNYNNMIDELGAATPINLTITGGMTSWGNTVNAATVPTHTTNLGNINEIIHSAHPASIQFRFTGLTAGSNYRIWVLGLWEDSVAMALDQNVTITGMGTINFSQTGPSRDLVVNNTVGSNAVNLANYAQNVAAAGDGSITITVTSNGAHWAVAGLAIEQATSTSAPTLSKTFIPGRIPTGGTSTLTFTIDNTGSMLTASSLVLTDNMPSDIIVVNPANISTTCTGGTLTAVPGTSDISYTGGTVAAGSVCTISVDVTGNDVGNYTNTTGDLTSSSGNSGSASDVLIVNQGFAWWTFWPAMLKAFQDHNQTP